MVNTALLDKLTAEPLYYAWLVGVQQHFSQICNNPRQHPCPCPSLITSTLGFLYSVLNYFFNSLINHTIDHDDHFTVSKSLLKTCSRWP